MVLRKYKIYYILLYNLLYLSHHFYTFYTFRLLKFSKPHIISSITIIMDLLFLVPTLYTKLNYSKTTFPSFELDTSKY